MRGSATVLLFVTLLLSACAATQTRADLDRLYGNERVRDRVIPGPIAGHVDYWSEVRPILESRCVVCHGCYDAPCQVKLDAVEGLDRGAHKEKVFEPSRLLAMSLTRLFEDASSTSEWRQKGFHPVLNERDDTAEANLRGSVLYRMLELKKQNPLPSAPLLEGFELGIDREQTCPTIEEFPDYAEKHPTWGMPYGLPALSEREFRTIERWIEEGARFTARPDPASALAREVTTWEKLLNQDDPKSRLISRYVYEHLFMAHLHFSDVTPRGKTPDFFELVRSRTPPGSAVDRISSRRPFEDPKIERVYYRLTPLETTVLVKNHLPYALDARRHARYRELFFDAPFEVKTLPGYDPELSANPFATYAQIPVDSRYRFLLDDAHFIIDGFIKGPVCHGQVALNVIEDRFWITFVRPEAASTPADARFYAEHASDLALPAGEESNTDVALNWLKYSEKQKRYLRERAAFLNEKLDRPSDVTLDLLWDGGGTNRDAALTVMRHEDSATVVRGLVGAPPKTSWVLGYGLLERIHYLLVAGFDVFGNVGHQVSTRLYMDFLRMESEMNFLSFLPRDTRKTLRDEWYEDAEDVAREYIQSADASFTGETGLKFSSMNPELELYERLQKHLAPIVDRTHFIEDDSSPQITRMATALSRLVGDGARQFPPLSFLEIVHSSEKSTYATLVRDDWHTNVTSLFFEKNNRRPEQDRLTVAQGFVGAYPNAFFRVKLDELEAWTKAVTRMKSDDDYRRLRDRFAVRRTSADFWGFADALHADALTRAPLAGGLFDFSRLENR